MNQSFRDVYEQAPRGLIVKGRIEVGGLASGMAITQPYLILRGERDGPCLWINGSVHGTELNGVLAALDFINGLDPAALRGSVVVTPFANPMATDARQKNTPQDGQDLDQTFPGNASGQLSDRLSASLFATAPDVADLLISMHTMGGPFNSDPYAVYKLHPNGMVGEAELLGYIRNFSPFVACMMNVAPGQGELPGNIAGAIDYQMLSRGKPAFMVELGGGSRVQEDFVRRGVDGFHGVARAMGILDGAPAAPAGICKVSRRHHVMCSAAGLFRAGALPGTEIPAGRSIGRVVSAFGEVVQDIVFDRPVKLIGIRSDPVVHTGDRVAFVATQWSQQP